MSVASKLRGTSSLAGARSLNIAVGQFFFRYRNALFPVIFLLAVIAFRPKILFGSRTVNEIMVFLGVTAAVCGECFRLMTIGWEYIHRGGKDGKVYAQRLVTRGMYGITRNPMYIGNGLIAVGMAIASCSPAIYILIIPLFLFVYQAIICAEEDYLESKFGTEYEVYRAKVNRLIPSLRLVGEVFSGMRYNKMTALRHDLSTATGLAIGLIALPVWRSYFLEDSRTTQTAAVRALALACAVGFIFALLSYLKRHKRLFYEGTSRPPTKASPGASTSHISASSTPRSDSNTGDG